MGILPNVADDLNVSIASAGQLITMYALGVAVGAPILTVLTHQIPQKSCFCCSWACLFWVTVFRSSLRAMPF